MTNSFSSSSISLSLSFPCTRRPPPDLWPLTTACELEFQTMEVVLRQQYSPANTLSSFSSRNDAIAQSIDASCRDCESCYIRHARSKRHPILTLGRAVAKSASTALQATHLDVDTVREWRSSTNVYIKGLPDHCTHDWLIQWARKIAEPVSVKALRVQGLEKLCNGVGTSLLLTQYALANLADPSIRLRPLSPTCACSRFPGVGKCHGWPRGLVCKGAAILWGFCLPAYVQIARKPMQPKCSALPTPSLRISTYHMSVYVSVIS